VHILKQRKKTLRSLVAAPTGVRAVVLAVFFAVLCSHGLSLSALAAGACDTRVQDVWKPLVIQIAGIKYFLSKAVTLDLNNNPQVDNVSFTFITKDGGKKVFNYFGIAGGISARDFPALALPDESLIGRLCFGKITYDKRQYFMQEPLKRPLLGIKSPDLAAQMEARKRGIADKPKTKKEKEKEKSAWVLWGVLGGLLLLAVTVAGLFAIHRRKTAAAGDEKP